MRDLNGALKVPVPDVELVVDGRPAADLGQQIEQRRSSQRLHRLVDVQTRMVIFLRFLLSVAL